MIGVGIAFLLEYLDNSIVTEQDVEDKLGLPILGVVAHIDESEIVRGHTVPMTGAATYVNGAESWTRSLPFAADHASVGSFNTAIQVRHV